MKHRPNFTNEQIYNMYHEDYINYVLKPTIRSGLIVGEYICIKNLFPSLIEGQYLWESNIDNPYIKQNIYDKEKLGLSILNNGMYFPFFVFPINGTNNYCVFEGRHRVDSLRKLMLNGKLSPEHKFLCMIAPYRFSYNHDKYKQIFVPDTKYRILDTDQIFKRQEYDINNSIMINNYTYQNITNSALDLVLAMERYQYSLSNWFYYYNVSPNEIINNEELYNEWIKMN